ncbi:hypothetical protein EW145_g5581 [Phellinidium pouzarii]|uniref:Uncharacterized protein n=1 Tax=Phellinidium pouzarii TaxID=167371 RepID=A0A4S4KZH0_9AGAM|nr:hypothetical protein EW145_g5581 [Phellinidium pouzarii]
MANAASFFPHTPSPGRFLTFSHDYRPTKSSPLAPLVLSPSSSPGPISPVVEAQTRRRSQYKSRTAGPSNRAIGSPPASETNQTVFLRERFKAKCFERARLAREKGVLRRRSAASDISSDGFDVEMDMDDEDIRDDDDGFDDELFQRIVTNEKRKLAHTYALSYELDVGSSFDPDMEDAEEWERHVQSPATVTRTSQIQQEEDLSPPDDFDEPNFDEFDELDENSTWVDEYIANLTVGSEEKEIAVATQHSLSHSNAQSDQSRGSMAARMETSVIGMEDVAMQ